MANSVVALTFLAAYIVATAFVPLTSGTAFAATNDVDNEGVQVPAQGIEQEQEQNDKKSSKLPKEPHSNPEAGVEAGLTSLEKDVKQQEKDDGVQHETTPPEQAKKALEQEQSSPDGLTTESDRANKQDDHKKVSAVTEEPKVTPEVKKAIVEDNDKTSQHDNKGKSQDEAPRQAQYAPEPKKDSDERGDKLDGRESEHKKDDKKPGEDRGGKKDECRDGEQGSPAFMSSKIIGGQKDRDNCEPEQHDDECLDRDDQSFIGFRHISDREKDTRKDCDREKAKDDDKDKIKVFVCKYVGTPWVDERLKDGKNPISVGITEGQDRTPGTYFNDAHGSSYVLAYDTGQENPGVEACPVPRVPIKATPAAPQQQVVCWADNDIITLPEVDGVSYSVTEWVEGSLTVTATADDHHYFSEGTQSEWVFTDEDTPCAVTRAPPTVVVVCGANNDTLTLPTVTGVTYHSTGWVNGKVTVTATANDGYVFPDETVASWTFTDTNTPCGNVLGDTTTTPSVTATVVPLVASTATLADTGTNMSLVALLSSGLLGAALLTVLQNSKRGSKVVNQLHRIFYDLQLAFKAPFVLPTA